MSHYHTTEEKTGLQIQKDQVLSFLFYEEEEAAGEIWYGFSGCTTDYTGHKLLLTETQWPLVVDSEH